MFLLRKYVIEGSSMIPILNHGDKILASSLPYLFEGPKLDDLLICKNPKNGKIIVKRLIKIVNGKYFVAGDNQKASTDSKNFGFLERKDIIGKVIFIIPNPRISSSKKA